MKKLKKILLGALSALTLGLFVATGAKVIAATADYTYSFDAFSDSGYSDSNCQSGMGSTETVQTSSWYTKKTVNELASTPNYFGSAIRWSNSVVYRIGNDTTNALVSGIDSKYRPSDFNVAETNVGYVSGMNAISNITSLSISYNNSKTNAGVYYLMVSSDDANYSCIKTGDCKSLNLNATITVALNQSTNKYEATLGTTVVELGDTNALGYAIVMATTTAGKNIQTTTWTTNYTRSIETDATTFNVKFYDINSDELTSYGKTVIENDTVSQPSAPTVFGKQLKHWAVGSSDGSAYDFSQAVTSDLSLYAVYEEYETDEYSLTVDYMKYAGDYYGSSNITSDKPLSPTRYTFVYGDVDKNFFATDAKSVGTYGNSTYAIKTAGSVQANGGSSLNINLDKTGTFTIYARSGSSTARNIRFYTPGTQNAAFESTDQVTNDSTVQSVTVNVTTTGEYNIGSNGGIYIYAIIFTPHISNGTSAGVFAEINSTGDTLRFVGGMSGITDLDNIDSIELILTKDNVASKKQIFLTTCYISVANASVDCPASDGVFYVIFRLTGVSGITGTFTKQLKITFTDGSTTLSSVTDTVLK